MGQADGRVRRKTLLLTYEYFILKKALGRRFAQIKTDNSDSYRQILSHLLGELFFRF